MHAGIRAAGASLVALSPELPEHSAELIGTRGLDFEILQDRGNAVAETFGLRFELPEELRRIYQGFGIDLAAANGEPSWTLAMPARYIVDPDSRIRYARVHPDYTRRPEPSETLEAL